MTVIPERQKIYEVLQAQKQGLRLSEIVAIPPSRHNGASLYSAR